jgi:hypothetical protein
MTLQTNIVLACLQVKSRIHTLLGSSDKARPCHQALKIRCGLYSVWDLHRRYTSLLPDDIEKQLLKHYIFYPHYGQCSKNENLQ